MLSAFLLTGCATVPTDTIRQTIHQLSELPRQHEIANTPFFPQTEYQCGAAALATVLNYRSLRIEPTQLEPLLYIPAKKGSLSIELVAQARQQGLVAYQIAPKLENLIQEIHANNPVLVFQNLGLSWFPQWHYAVVIGYDLEQQTLLLRSGTTRRHQVSLQAFMNTWMRARQWAIAIVPPDTLPATAEVLPWLQATSDLEQFVPEAAEQAYITALSRWPENTEVDNLARLGLANIAYQKEDYVKARDWLLKGNGPASAAQWNNLAYTLMELQCPQAPLQAVLCALKLQPTNPNLKSSYQELVDRNPSSSEHIAELCMIPQC